MAVEAGKPGVGPAFFINALTPLAVDEFRQAHLGCAVIRRQ